MTRIDEIKEDLDHIHSDCRRIEDQVSRLSVYMNGIYPDAIITKGKFFATGQLIKDLNKHWDNVIRLVDEQNDE